MIPGDTIRPIKSFDYIDRNAEGLGTVEREGIIGIPASYYDTGEPAFIEIWDGDVLVQTVNCADVSNIVFK